MVVIFKRHPLYQNYMISTVGDVYNLRTKRFIGTIGSVGYPVASICRYGTKSIHVLVLETFSPKPNNGQTLYVNHKDLDKTNNNVENLEWVTPARNIQHAAENGRISKGEESPTSKLKESQVIDICERLQNGESQTRLGEMYGVLPTAIHQIKNGDNWKHISSRFSFDIKPKTPKLDNSLIVKICEMISDGVKRSVIHEITGVSVDILKAIRLRRNYSSISKYYKW